MARKRPSGNPVHGGDAGAAGKQPVARNEDVEFSMDMADEDDLEALERSEAAACRVLGEPDDG